MRIVSLLAGAALFAAAADFDAPVIGYFLDAKMQRIRPLAGTPGAATIGPPLADHATERALIAPDGAFAVIATGQSASLEYLRPLQGQVAAIEGTPPNFEYGALSPSASSAAVFADSCRCVLVLSSLRSAPVVLRTISISEELVVRAVAVTDDGSAVAIASEDRVWIDGLGFDMPAAAKALAFSGDGTQLALADAARKTVTVIADLPGSPTIRDVLTEREGITSTVAVRFLGSGTLLAADVGGSIRLVDLAAPSLRAVECPCKPALAEATASSRFVRVTGSEEGAVWIIDTAEESPRALFIPELAQ